MSSFLNLGIEDSILDIIKQEGFSKPTEIQEKSIPLILEGKDVIGRSATGSGKTLAFAIGIIQNSDNNKGIKSLVLTPTREIAEQVKDQIKKFSQNKKMRVISVYGGVSISPQMQALRKADVVVGTPGRILDHLERGTIDFSGLQMLVLDEADRMLDMGFFDDVRKIIGECPDDRQTMLFSATMPTEIRSLAERYMKSPVNIAAKAHVDPSKMKQVYYEVQPNLKFSLLVHLLQNEASGLVMVFCNTKRNVDFVTDNLQRLGIDVNAIHGGYSQKRRLDVLKKFNSKKAHVLVCTDVAARGLDIPSVSHIYNYDIPNDSKEYVHRIGRTARAGKEGIAVNILTRRDHENFARVVSDNRTFNIVKEKVPFIKKVGFKLDDNNGSRDRYGSGRQGSRSGSRGGPRGRGSGSRGLGRGNSGRGGSGGGFKRNIQYAEF